MSNKCKHPQLFLKDWVTDDYKIDCPDCKKSIYFEEIEERDNLLFQLFRSQEHANN